MANKISFSNVVIKALPAVSQPKPVWYYDTKVEGLALTVSRTGVKSFKYKRWVESAGGKQEYQLGRFSEAAQQSKDFENNPLSVLGNNPELNTEQARHLARSINGIFSTGMNPFKHAKDQLTRRQAELTLAEMFGLYMEKHYIGRRKRPEDVVSLFDYHCSAIQDRLLSSISHTEAITVHSTITKNRGPYVANRVIQMLRAIYNKAALWEFFEGRNPFASVTLNPEKERNFALTEDEAQRLYRAFENDNNEMIRDYGRLLMLTGVRKTQLCRMAWNDIVWDEGYWVAPLQDVKTNESRFVSLNGMAMEVLKQRRALVAADCEWVFPSKDDKQEPMRDPKKSFRRVCESVQLDKKVGNRHCTLHDVRRSFGTQMARLEGNPKVVQMALGHKDAKTTQKHYLVASLDLQKAAATKVASSWVMPRDAQ